MAENQGEGSILINNYFINISLALGIFSTVKRLYIASVSTPIEAMKFIFSRLFNYILIFILVVLTSCDNEQIDSQIPFISFPDIIINLKSQQYLSLQSERHVTTDGGVRGIIIWKSPFGNEYIAFERNCSYQPNDACALVEVVASGLSMQDLCCGSTFEFSQGNPTGGPTRSPLRRYRTSISGDFLTITDEPLN